MKLYGRPDIVKRIIELRMEGRSYVNITFDIYDEFGVKLSPASIAYQCDEKTRAKTKERVARNYRKRKDAYLASLEV